MTIFAIIAKSSPEKIREKVEATYPDDNYEFTANSWFIYDTVTARGVGEKLEIVEGKLGAQGIILPLGGWYGWAAADTWEWLKPRWEKDHPNG